MNWLASKIGGWLAAAGAVILVIFGAWAKGRREGKAAMQEEQERHRREARELKRNIDGETDARSDADLDRDLDRWVRR